MQGWWKRFHLARTRLQFRDDFDRIQREFSPNFLSKAPRSGHDWGSIVVLGLCRSSSDQVGAIPRQKRCDRGSIAARWDRDRGVLPRFVCNVRWLEPQVIWRVTIAHHRGRRIAIETGVHRQPSICEDRDEGYCEQSRASISR